MKLFFPMTTDIEGALPLYVTSIGSNQNQEHVVRPEGFDSYHWLHCAGGSGVLIIGGREYKISESMGFFFSPGIPHEYYSLSEPWSTKWITFKGNGCEDLLKLLGMGNWEVFHISSVKTIDIMLEEIYLSLKARKPFNLLESSSLLYSLLVKLKSLILESSPKQKNSPINKIQPVVAFMESCYNTSASLEEMASIINITPYTLCRLFKQAYNMSPFKYLAGLRIQKAKELLVNSPVMHVRDIAALAGYNDASYFCAVFKEHEGITPLDFRRLHRVI